MVNQHSDISFLSHTNIAAVALIIISYNRKEWHYKYEVWCHIVEQHLKAFTRILCYTKIPVIFFPTQPLWSQLALIRHDGQNLRGMSKTTPLPLEGKYNGDKNANNFIRTI